MKNKKTKTYQLMLLKVTSIDRFFKFFLLIRVNRLFDSFFNVRFYNILKKGVTICFHLWTRYG